MNNYIPVLVERDGKKDLWRMDISRLSVTELIKLKEELMTVPYDNTIQILNAIIKSEVQLIHSSSSIDKCSYMRSYKKNKKKTKIEKESKMKKQKLGGDINDKY